MSRLLGGHMKRNKSSFKQADYYYKKSLKIEQHKNHIKNLNNTKSKYKGIKLVCAWTERDGKEAFVIPCLGNKIIWIPTECVKHIGEYVRVLKHRIDIDHCFEEAGYPIEHIKLKMQMDKAKKVRRA